jgi:hypothetical protein
MPYFEALPAALAMRFRMAVSAARCDAMSGSEE